jgi:hypothetical protein
LFAAGYFFIGVRFGGRFCWNFLNRTDIIKHFKVEDELNIARLVMKEFKEWLDRKIIKPSLWQNLFDS